MARVLVLSLVYKPDTVSTANLMAEIVNGLRDRGHDMTVLTSIPHYNPSPEVRSNRAYRTSIWRWFTITDEAGVRVIRIAMPRKRQRILARLLDYLWLHFFTTIVAMLKLRRIDVVFVPSPPITLGLNGYLIARLLRAKLIYDVRELWPDVPIRMGVIRNRMVVRVILAVESFVYRKSVAITSIARSFNRALIKVGVPESKLFFTPNFVDVAWLQPGSHDTPFARQNDFAGKFVVFYAGNIGLTQGLELLIDVARMLEQSAPDAVVVVVGDGAGRPKFEAELRKSALRNVRLLPFQPYNHVPETYASAHVCVSPMRYGFSYETVPSKIYTAMAAGRPMISACESDTESAALVRESQGGIVCEPESATEMVAAVQRLYDDRDLTRRMGESARKWIVDYYSRDAVVKTYDEVIRRVAGE
jgi:colanic acid biosynthesis glycosyl transferase WcaI